MVSQDDLARSATPIATVSSDAIVVTTKAG